MTGGGGGIFKLWNLDKFFDTQKTFLHHVLFKLKNGALFYADS